VKSIRSIVAAFALAVCLVPHASPAAPALSQLRGIQELESWFNMFKGHPPLILLLSPT
jgi:hypothetical protein